MAINRCPSAEANKQAHAEFRVLFGHVKGRLVNPRGPEAMSLAIILHREVASWIRRHILNVDSGLRACAHRSHISASPAARAPRASQPSS